MATENNLDPRSLEPLDEPRETAKPATKVSCEHGWSRCATTSALGRGGRASLLICGVNDIAAHGGEEDDDVTRRRPLYVAMTRATEQLFITVSGHGRIGADVLAASS